MKTKTLALLLLSITILSALTGKAQINNDKPIRDFQLSVVPFIGTEGRDAMNYRYRFSVNLFAGITGGIEGIEAGGFMNISNGPVTGLQLSGFGNLVRGNIEGFQGAGFMNINHGDSKGFFGAGFINFVSGRSEGFYGAGFINVTGGHNKSFSGAGFANVIGGNFEGAQGSGFINLIGGSFTGAQGAGFANVTGGNVKGIIGAGFANVTGGEFEGLQAAGFANVTGNFSRGPQIAGFMNVSRDFQGIQIAGFMNVAKNVQGVQLGFLNIADTVDGVPIGFLSIVKKGAYRQLELSGSDVMHAGASFRIGVPVFYNIFSFGTRPFSDERNSGFGYGIGTNIRLSEPAAMQIEVHSTQLHRDWKWDTDNPDMLNELRITFSANLHGRLQLFAGPVLYNQIYKEIPGENIFGSDLSSYSFGERRFDDYVSKWWVGARGGLRLRLN